MLPLDCSKQQRVSVTVTGMHITVTLDKQIVLIAKDNVYTSGSVGLHIVDTHAVFSKFDAKSVSVKIE